MLTISALQYSPGPLKPLKKDRRRHYHLSQTTIKKKWHLKANPIKTGMFITSEESPSKQKIENKMGRQRTEKTFTSSLSWCHS